MWEGQALPHDTKLGNCRCEIVGRRMIFIWSLIHGSSWSGLIKVGPDCPLCHSRPIQKIGKSINPFYRDVANRHAAALDRRPWHSLDRRETVKVIITCAVPGIPWKFHESPFTRFSIALLRNTDPRNRKMYPEFKGLIATFWKCSSLFLVSCANFAVNVMKIHPYVSSNMVNRHGFPRKHRKRNPVLKGLNVTLNTFFRMFILSCPTYPENVMKIRPRVFP